MTRDATGFVFGKMPTHGDFVARGLGAPDRLRLDDWLSSEMLDARDRCGAAFDYRYDGAPIWRFVTTEGDRWRIGAIAPSMDAVGRRFPLIVGTYRSEPNADVAEYCEERLYDAFDMGWTVDQLHESLRAEIISEQCRSWGSRWWTVGNADFAEREMEGDLPVGLLFAMLTPQDEAR